MGRIVEVSADTRVDLRKDLAGYQASQVGDIRVLVSGDLAPHLTNLRLDIGRFLFLFRGLRPS